MAHTLLLSYHMFYLSNKYITLLQGHGRETEHKPELVLNNYTTPTSINAIKHFLNIPLLQGHGRATEHKPELVLNNFGTRIGRRVGRMFASLFAQVCSCIARCLSVSCVIMCLSFVYGSFVSCFV